MRRRPAWACPEYADHGEFAICPECLRLYEASGRERRGYDLPPRVTFAAGWFSMGATHYFTATDATVFPSRDGHRTLAQAVCGGICEVTIAHASRAGDECRKCLSALGHRDARLKGAAERKKAPATGRPKVTH